MSTFLNEFFLSLDERWKEVNLLISVAEEKEKEGATAVYDAVCRGALLLTVAHFEAILKDTAKAIVSDSNKFSTFASSPSAMKRTFCRPFIGDTFGTEKEVEQRIIKLMSVFEALDTKFEVSPFLIEDNYGGNNKNPSPNIIQKVCNNFGIKNFFTWLNDSDVDLVFSGTSSEINDLLKRMSMHIEDESQSFSYTLDPSKFNLDNSRQKPEGRTFYETFIDELLKKRHEIAHGSVTANTSSVADLLENLLKVKILVCAFVIILGHKSLPSQ